MQCDTEQADICYHDRITTPSLSLTGRMWHIARTTPFPVNAPIATTLAAERGIRLDERTTDRLSDPSHFPEIRSAVDRVKRAVAHGETIGIFGDYDADGITGTVLLVHALRRRGCEPIIYLPHRADEGYGLRHSSIEKLSAQGVTLLITVDTGITAHEEIAFASSRGIDTIVTDHHHPRGGRPPAFAVLHPLVPSPFPNPHLCGAGVALLFVRALEEGRPWEGVERDLVLAAIGTIGDIVPLTGENRTLVLHGLRRIPSLPPSPLKDLLDIVSGGARITSGDIAFRVVPRINAAGRMDHPKIALDALLSGGASLEKLHALNGDRQALVADLMEEAEAAIDMSRQFLCIALPSFTPGTVGLVAGKLTERTGKPSFVGAVQGERIVASLRSPASVHVTQCLEHPAVLPHLVSFGGHTQAAGCTCDTSKLPLIADGLNTAIREHIGEAQLLPTLAIDAVLAEGAVSVSTVRLLQDLGPFGAGNTEPLFFLPARSLRDVRTVGRDGAHLHCIIDGVQAVGFRLGGFCDRISPSASMDIACRLSLNAWQGKERPQIIIEDLRPASSLQ